eukprot:GFKZ01008963.1.p1 GENE.GFKZ01008963.1~~GFKZ01008963.1.p1  ORF type:complete len:299 (+),score=30.36 GFKZ01008963.1:117-1013(+)
MSALLLLILLLPHATYSRPFRLDGHISHGINNFNNLPIVNFSTSSLFFASLPPIPEIGVLTTNPPDATNASLITPATPLSSLMATINPTNFQTSLGFPPGVGPFNIPLARTPTLFFTSTSVNDRVTPLPFVDSINPATLSAPYLSREADSAITLRDWNRASARITATCRNSAATVRVRLRNALPNAIFSLWNVGVTDPLTENEALSAGPFGGLPNVIVTDGSGRGTVVRRLRYCPFDRCERGVARCTLYVTLSYHFDHVVYGGTPSLDFAGQATGMVVADQVQFYLNGEQLVPPQNPF